MGKSQSTSCDIISSQAVVLGRSGGQVLTPGDSQRGTDGFSIEEGNENKVSRLRRGYFVRVNEFYRTTWMFELFGNVSCEVRRCSEV